MVEERHELTTRHQVNKNDIISLKINNFFILLFHQTITIVVASNFALKCRYRSQHTSLKTHHNFKPSFIIEIEEAAEAKEEIDSLRIPRG